MSRGRRKCGNCGSTKTRKTRWSEKRGRLWCSKCFTYFISTGRVSKAAKKVKKAKIKKPEIKREIPIPERKTRGGIFKRVKNFFSRKQV